MKFSVKVRRWFLGLVSFAELYEWLWSSFPITIRRRLATDEIVGSGGRIHYPYNENGVAQCVVIPFREVTVAVEGSREEPIHLQPLDVLQLSAIPADKLIRLTLQGEAVH